jgi:tetracycline repressor-like protein
MRVVVTEVAGEWQHPPRRARHRRAQRCQHVGGTDRAGRPGRVSAVPPGPWQAIYEIRAGDTTVWVDQRSRTPRHPRADGNALAARFCALPRRRHGARDGHPPWASQGPGRRHPAGFAALLRDSAVTALEQHELPACEDPDRLAFELYAILLAADTKFVLLDDPTVLDLARQVVHQRPGLGNARNADEV